ncbi:zinc finger protein ZIC 4-like [Antechinus flavipes]|uniref:zinc finger protein ZIC 4-like n=1 Tax=Antechinus flavipes TaxID=38775 RepID=UPI00223563FB|nr:zinc finger protein ZIC 4-like [Antechinus flavipes]
MSVEALGSPVMEPAALSKRNPALRLVDLAGAHHHHHHHHHHHPPQSVTGFPGFAGHPHSMAPSHPGEYAAESRLGPSPFRAEHMGHHHPSALKLSPAHHPHPHHRHQHHHHHHHHHHHPSLLLLLLLLLHLLILWQEATLRWSVVQPERLAQCLQQLSLTLSPTPLRRLRQVGTS